MSTEPTPSSTKKAVSFFGLFYYSTLLDKIFILIGTILAILAGLTFPMVSISFGNNLDAFVNHQRENEQQIKIEGFDFKREIQENCMWLLGLGALCFVCCYIATILYAYAANNQSRTIQLKFFRAALSQDMSWYDVNQSKDFAVKMTTDLNRVQEGIGDRLGLTFFLAAVSASTLIGAFVNHWLLTLIVFGVVPLTVICYTIMSFIQGKVSRRETQTYGQAGSIAEEVLGAIRTVFAFGGEAKEAQRYERKVEETRKWALRRGLITGLNQSITWFFTFGSYAVVFLFGVFLFNQGTITAGQITNVFFNIVFATFYCTQIAPYFEAYASAKAAATEIYAAIERKPLIDNFSEEGKQISDCVGTFEFRNVHFSYPNRPDVKILQGINLTIEAGKTVALIGPSGSGKSTCLQLIQRYYDAESGSVTLDGEDIRNINVGSYREQIAVVGQEPILFSMSILDNIKMGKPTATMEEVEAASIDAGAHTFISRLPDGYNTIIGERGGQLSGGQKQRIAIARALVKNPRILLLDEATSALDMQSERYVQEALERASEGRTTVVVAHRLSTIQNADKIIVMERGLVKEVGKHNDLLALQGLYYELVNHQRQADAEDPPLEATLATPSADIPSMDSTILSTQSVGTLTKESSKTRFVVGRIMRMVIKHPIALTIGCLSAISMGLTFPLYGYLFGELVGVLSEEQQSDRMKNTYKLCGIFVGLGLFSAVASFSQIYAFSIIGESLTMKLRCLIFEAFLRQESGYFDFPVNSVGALCTRLASDTSDVQGIGGFKASIILQAISCTIGVTILAFAFSWKIGLIVFIFIPILIAGEGFEQMLMVRQAVKASAMKQASSKIAIEALSSIKTIISLRAEETFYKRFDEALKKQYGKVHLRVHIHGIVVALSQSAFLFCYGVCIWYGSELTVKGELKYKDLFKIMEGVVFSTELMGQALAVSSDIMRGRIAAINIFALLERKPLINSSKDAGVIPTKFNGEIRFEKVYFAYPTRRKTRVLRGLTFDIKKGQSVALVGESGCGKSTTIQLLERYYTPDNGTLTIDGMDIKALNVPWLRSQIGLVQQEPILFAYSIAENIAYGDNERVVPMAEIQEAARKANAHTFIESLPKGYNTDVGDKGAQLSGGQKQRIAIARALVRNPKLLLLDEATSALDSHSEKIVQEALDAAMQGRTCVMIAHRLSTIENADKIVVFKRGKVAEEGTHKELLSAGKNYYKLYNAQK